MPTYEYACKNCGETFEVFQSFSEKPLKRHSSCGGDLQKVIHASGIVFKGSGFYATDSKGKTTSQDKGTKDRGSRESDSKDRSSKDTSSKEKKTTPKSDKAPATVTGSGD